MAQRKNIFTLKSSLKAYQLNIILPAFLTLLLFIITLFFVVIPITGKIMTELKKEEIRELNSTTWNILNTYYMSELSGTMTWEDAMNKAKSHIEHLRYGKENKDYFWIIDTKGNMIVHPYRKDLVNTNVLNFRDKEGNELFKKAISICNENKQGYINYFWQWKDNPNKTEKKISHVKLFEPWGWIIGTGLYVNDVRVEIKNLTKWIIDLSVIIIVIITLVLIYIVRQGLKSEMQKQLTEKRLKETKDRYQALAEASTEGTILWFDDHNINANKSMLAFLGFNESEISRLSIFDLISKDQIDAYLGEKYFRHLALGIAQPRQFEARVRKKDGTYIKLFLSCTRFKLGDRNAVIIAAKDTSLERIVQQKLGLSREKYKELINILELGIFKSSFGDQPRLIDANPAFCQIMGFRSENDISDYSILDHFADEEEKKTFLHHLYLAGFVRNRDVRLIKNDGAYATVNLSVVLVNDSENNSIYFDGMIEDKTLMRKKEMEKEALLVEFQSSQHILNLPVMELAREIIYCSANSTVKEAVSIMVNAKRNAILVFNTENKCTGIITNNDLREKVLFNQTDFNTKVTEIMTSPVISVHDKSFVYEAILTMNENKISSLGVVNTDGNITGIISITDILNLQSQTSSYLLKEINDSKSVEEIALVKDKIFTLVKTLINSSSNPSNVSRVISNISDAITIRLCELSIEELGQPPLPFAFVALGSEGRQEQTLATDQDNCLIYKDPGDLKDKSVIDYFNKLSKKICNGLDQAGYNFCQADIMAKNPKWCQPVSVWKEYYNNWINSMQEDDVFDANVFFDLRTIYGNTHLVNELKAHIHTVSQNQTSFFRLLAENASRFKPPMNIFGKLILETSAKYMQAFDVKKSMMPIIIISRMYAVKYNFTEVNTLDRLFRMQEKNLLSELAYAELLQSYNFLMSLRFKAQYASLEAGFAPDNMVNAKKLTDIEHAMLKSIFSHINSFISKATSSI